MSTATTRRLATATFASSLAGTCQIRLVQSDTQFIVIRTLSAGWGDIPDVARFTDRQKAADAYTDSCRWAAQRFR